MNAIAGLALEAPARPWDVLATVPVPLRLRVRQEFAALFESLACESAPKLTWQMPLGQGGHTPFERLRRVRAPDDFPAMVLSADDTPIFNRRFYARHVATGGFTAAQPGACGAFSQAGLIDPRGEIGVYGAAPFVFLVDRTRLGARPVPGSWNDLLHQRYRGEIVFGGWRRGGSGRFTHFNRFLLLCLAHRFGLAGLAAFLSNVPTLLHSAEMPRLAGTAGSPAAIYILPWSLAALCPRRAVTDLIWPSEGAFAYPLWLTVKTTQAARLRPVLDYVHGAAMAALLNQNRYPAASACTLPEGARLVFPGWDFIRDPATAGIVRAACDAMHAALGAAKTVSCRCA